MWSLELSTAPTLEPLTLDEVRDQLNIDTSAQDGLLDAIRVAARGEIESRLSKALLTSTWKLRLGGWPSTGEIRLPRPPLVSVSSIAYIDTNGASQTLAASQYTVDKYVEPGRIVPAYGVSWPSLRAVPANVTVTYIAGWPAPGSIPREILQAMLLTIGHLYEQRETHIVGTIVEELPTVMRLLASHRCYYEFREECG